MKINSLLFFLFFISALQAKQIEVCESCTITSIKDAIEISENGDEILLKQACIKNTILLLISP